MLLECSQNPHGFVGDGARRVAVRRAIGYPKPSASLTFVMPFLLYVFIFVAESGAILDDRQ